MFNPTKPMSRFQSSTMARAFPRINTNTFSKNSDRQKAAANIGIPPASASPFADWLSKPIEARSVSRASPEKAAPSGLIYQFEIKQASISARLHLQPEIFTRLGEVANF